MSKVLINLSDRQFGEDLAFSLSGLSDKLSIDLENKGEYDYVIDDKTEEILPVSALLDRIIGSYTEMTGKPFYGLEKGLKKAFLFTSPEGGRGLSAVAFSVVRMLSGIFGQKILYVDVGQRGRFCAGEYTETAQGDIREMEYMIKNNGLRYPMKYLSRDHFGPFVICMEKYDAGIISSIADAGGFSRLVVAGADGDFEFCEEKVRVQVINMKDVRSSGMEPGTIEFDFIVRNRDYINSVSGNEISISDDSLSFKYMNGGLRISLSGEFGIGIEKLVKEITEEDGSGVFWEMS